MPKRYRDKYLDKNEKDISTNHMYDYRMMSYVNKDNSKMWVDGDDVFNYVHDNSATFKISKAYETSYFDTDEDPVLSGYLESFKAYIRETESPRSAEKMILFLEQRVAGCKGVEIAGMMKVSNNMVKIIKHTLRKKYDTWQTIDA
jgi:DNA-directed RNA polymerase specialized sigma24 family protein